MITLTNIPPPIVFYGGGKSAIHHPRSGKVLRLLSAGLTLTLCLPLGVWSLPVSAETKVTFAPQTPFAVGSGPDSVATADFNGDGHTDLVTANFFSNNVSVLLGNGLGGFGAPTPFAVGYWPVSVATADFNGDGKTDLVAANWSSNTVSVLLNTTTPALFTSLNDIDGDGNPEMAAVLYDIGLQKTTAQVKNASTGALVKQIPFNGQFVPKRLAAIPDLNANGAAEIAVLGIRNSDQAVLVEIRDSLSGVKLGAVPFPATLPPIGLLPLRDSSCSSTVCLAVLQQNETALRVQLKDALTGTAIRTIRFSDGLNGKGLVLASDLNGNKVREFALFANAKTTGADYQVEIRDSRGGALIRTISFPAGEPMGGLLNLADLNRNQGTDLASLLLKIPQLTVVDTKTGTTLNTFATTLTKPFMLSQETDTGSNNQVALLGVRPSDGKNVAEVYDSLTGAVVHSIEFSSLGATVAFQRIVDVNGNGSSELVRVREQAGTTPQFVAEIRDGATGVLINTIDF